MQTKEFSHGLETTFSNFIRLVLHLNDRIRFCITFVAGSLPCCVSLRCKASDGGGVVRPLKSERDGGML